MYILLYIYVRIFLISGKKGMKFIHCVNEISHGKSPQYHAKYILGLFNAKTKKQTVFYNFYI